MSHKDLPLANSSNSTSGTTSVSESAISSLFSSIYSRNNCDDIFYGLGQLTPCNPYLFQSLDTNQPNYLEIFGSETKEIEECDRRREAMKEIIDDFVNENVIKEGHKYNCKIDNLQFSSETMILAHLKQCHRNTIEEMLHVLAAEDNELFFLGNFFTKLFYSDYIYPTARRDSIATDFPSVAAPDLDEIRKQPGTKQKKEKKRKDNKDIKKRKSLI